MSYKSGQIGSLRLTTGFRNGHGVLAGTVEEVGVYGSYLIRIYDQATGILIRNIYSSDSGNWSINALDVGVDLFCIAFDNEIGTVRNASIADRQRAGSI